MLSIPHLAIIFVVALVVFGPEKLPELARNIGKFMVEFRRITGDFRGSLDEHLRELEKEGDARRTAAAAAAAAAKAAAPTPAPTSPASLSAPVVSTPEASVKAADGIVPAADPRVVSSSSSETSTQATGEVAESSDQPETVSDGKPSA